MKQDAYTLHKPMRRNFKRNWVIVGGIDQQWQMDLADMQSMQKFNDGYRYLLVCIDVFSKYAWVIPLKNRTGPFTGWSFQSYSVFCAKACEDHDGSRNRVFKQTFPSVDEGGRYWIVQHVQWNQGVYRGTAYSYFENEDVAIFYSKENYEIHWHVAWSRVFLQSQHSL